MKQTFPVLGMHCAGCASRVEKCLGQQKGVRSASVNFAAHTVWVDYDEYKASPRAWKRAVEALGYDLVTEEERSVEAEERSAYLSLRRRVGWAWGLSVLVMAGTMWHAHSGEAGLLTPAVAASLLLALVCMAYCGGQFYRNAWRQLRQRTASMDTLVAMSTLISFLSVRYVDASAMIIAFVSRSFPEGGLASPG